MLFCFILVYSIFKLRDFEMEPVRVSGTVTIEEQRAYIKIETLRRKNLTEIHSALSDVCGEFNEWKAPSSPRRRKKCRRAQSKV